MADLVMLSKASALGPRSPITRLDRHADTDAVGLVQS